MVESGQETPIPEKICFVCSPNCHTALNRASTNNIQFIPQNTQTLAAFHSRVRLNAGVVAWKWCEPFGLTRPAGTRESNTPIVFMKHKTLQPQKTQRTQKPLNSERKNDTGHASGGCIDWFDGAQPVTLPALLEESSGCNAAFGFPVLRTIFLFCWSRGPRPGTPEQLSVRNAYRNCR